MGKPEISLRLIDLFDVDDFMVWVTDDRVSHFCRWDTYTSKVDSLDFMRNIVIPHPWFKAICIDNKPIGAISVEAKGGEDRCRGEIGYVLASEHLGKGIATLAVKMVMETIFKDWLHLERLEGFVDVENMGSQKVLEKAGFMKDGVFRKYVILKGTTRDMGMDYSRITLRPFKLSDIDDFMVWANDDQVIRYTGVTGFTSKEDGLRYLQKVSIPHPWRRSICLDDYSGYAMASQYSGQGIATVAIKIALSRVFIDIPRMERLQALVGFTKEGLLRKYMVFKGNIVDLVLHSFLSTDSVLDL
ncbi:hypothetical protein MKX01_009810 [Papaver californicum]|nr:hypothetical protein MKX01_009810 [Papaver californicum]